MFKVQIESNQKHLIRLLGPLGGEADLTLVRVSPDLDIEVDLVGLKSLNSQGLRKFIAWAASLTNPRITFSYCPHFFVDQLNKIKGMLPDRAKVSSFYVPYFSEASGDSKMILFSEGAQFKSVKGEIKFTWPEVKGVNGEVLEIDVDPEHHLAGLKKYL